MNITNNTGLPETVVQLIEDFACLPSWEERYAYIIEIGKTLDPLLPEERTETNQIEGCISQVWLIHTVSSDGNIHLKADSDSMIVKGLIAIILKMYSGQHAQNILALDPKLVFQKLGLESHLSPSRANGFFAIVKKIMHIAQNTILLIKNT